MAIVMDRNNGPSGERSESVKSYNHAIDLLEMRYLVA